MTESGGTDDAWDLIDNTASLVSAQMTMTSPCVDRK